MGGELGGFGILATNDDRVLCFGRKAVNAGIFLFRSVSGVVAGATDVLAETLVFLIFGGVSFL